MAEYKFEDNTKKASTRIFKELEKINPKISPKTTYQKAYEILMTEWDLEISVESTTTDTTVNIYKDNVVVYTFNWTRKETFNEREADWDWNFIYKNVLEHISKTRLYKRPKLSKSELRKIEKEKAINEKLAAKELAKQAKQAAKDAKVQAKLDKIKAKEDAKLAKQKAKEQKKLEKTNKASKRSKRS